MPSVAILGTRGYPSYYGGFETAVRKLAPFLADQGWDVTVYGRSRTKGEDSSNADPRVRVTTTRGIESRALSTITHGFTSSVHASRTRFDVALVMNVANGYWLPLLKARGIPTVVNVDGIEWERQKWSTAGKAVFYRGALMTAKHADRIVADSRAIAERWRTEFNRESDFIPYGGDDSPSYPVEPGLSHRGYALAVARFVPENSVGEFIEAASSLAVNHDVVLVGSSGYAGELDDRARALQELQPRFRWLGHLRDDRRLHSLWQHAGAYFHGHSVGGTNPALVQAMMCGAPTVARDTVFNREVLGEAAVFVQPDPEMIAVELSRLLQDESKQYDLSVRAKARAQADYTWEGVCRAYEDSLRMAMSARGLRV